MTLTEALVLVFNDDKRPRRHARAGVTPEVNDSDGAVFVRIRISEQGEYGLDVKQQFTIDEGTAYQLAEKLIFVLAELKQRKQ